MIIEGVGLLLTISNQGGDLSSIFPYLFWLALLALFLFQDYVMIWRYSYTISGFLAGLNRLITTSVTNIVNHVMQFARAVSKEHVERVVRDLMEYVVIEPVTLEPTGLINTLKHLLTTYSERVESIVSWLMPNANRPSIQNIVNAIESLRELNFIYKVIMHYFLLSTKYKNPYLMVQIYMLLPILREYVNALSGAINAFLKGFPIGDAAGPLVAFRFMRECESITEISHNVKDTFIGLCNFEGRRIYVIKARGPGGTVGRLDEAVMYVLERMSVRPRLIITVDAALKLEGEKTGSIAEGIGVAMGGVGVERFNIERIAAKYGIPLYAILIKMSIPEALSAMCKEVNDAVDEAVERVKSVLKSHVGPGEEAVLIGVGNTIGVSQ